jgi:hypothetical protein
MTVILNSSPGLPLPPAATPISPAREGEPGTSDFRNLLRGLIYPCAGAPGFLDAVAPEERPGASSPAPAADVFNQDGFFGSAVAGMEPTQTDRELASEAPGPAMQPPVDDGIPSEGSGTPDYGLQSAVKLGSSAPSTPAYPPTVSAEILASNWTTASTAVEDARSALPDTSGSNERLPGEIIPVRTAAARIPSSASAELTVGGGPKRGSDVSPAIRAASFRARLEALLPRLFAQDSAALSTRVSIQAVEHGLRVVARLGDLGQEDRIRLRDRIAAALSRHGLVGREITVNGDEDMASAEGNH